MTVTPPASLPVLAPSQNKAKSSNTCEFALQEGESEAPRSRGWEWSWGDLRGARSFQGCCEDHMIRAALQDMRPGYGLWDRPRESKRPWGWVADPLPAPPPLGFHGVAPFLPFQVLSRPGLPCS